MINTTYNKLIDFERNLDEYFISPQTDYANAKALLSAFNEWQVEVIKLANEMGKVSIPLDAIKKGLALAERPIFIGGAHRSGTTMMRDLFDGHQQICVLTGETNGLSRLSDKKKINSSEQLQELLYKWLILLLLSSGRAPYWFLGKTTPQKSPYVEYVRYFLSWLPIAQDHYHDNMQASLVSWMLAQASFFNDGYIPSNYRYWMEKTPLNEYHIDVAKKYFPKAKFLLLARDPENIYHSRKEIAHQLFEDFSSKYSIISAMALSQKIIASYHVGGSDPAVKVVRYEDFVRNKEKNLKDFCSFLSVDYEDSFEHQTIVGQNAFSNTSFTRRNPLTSVTVSEKKTLSALLSPHSQTLGYEMHTINSYEKVFFLFKYHLGFFTVRILGRIKRIIS